MRVLFVCPFLPWPLDSGGRIRTHHLVRAAARRVELELWCVREPNAPPGTEAELQRLGCPVRLFDRAPAGPARRWTRAKIERWFHSPALERALAERLAATDFDLVHVDELLLARALPPAPAAAVAQHHHKLDTDFHARLVRGPDPALRFDLWKLRRLEREAARRTRAHIACSAGDAARLEARHPGLRAWSLPSGFDADAFRPAPETRRGQRLVFVGSMDYAPNVDGLEFFAAEVWPRLRAHRPGLELDVVGRDPTPAVRALDGGGLRVRGTVDDVRPWLREAAALVVPLRIGGGTRLKIVEALALGTPTVSTRVGAEGLGLEDGEHLRLADHPEDLAAAVEEVLADPAEAAAMAERGRRFVDERYRWDALGERLAGIWGEIAALRGPGTPA